MKQKAGRLIKTKLRYSYLIIQNYKGVVYFVTLSNDASEKFFWLYSDFESSPYLK